MIETVGKRSYVNFIFTKSSNNQWEIHIYVGVMKWSQESHAMSH